MTNPPDDDAIVVRRGSPLNEGTAAGVTSDRGKAPIAAPDPSTTTRRPGQRANATEIRRRTPRRRLWDRKPGDVFVPDDEDGVPGGYMSESTLLPGANH